MLKPRMILVPAILGILPATVLLGAHASLAEPNGCRTKPGSSAPPSTHWLYRINPRDNRRCWFLSHGGVKARSHARNGTSLPAAARPTPRRENGGEAARAQDVEVPPARGTASEIAVQIASAQGASAKAAFTETSIGEHETSVDFTARWPDLPKSLDLHGRELVTMSTAFAEEPANGSEQLPSTPESEGMVAFMLAVLAAALVLLLAGAGFMLACRRQSDHRDHWRAAAGRRHPRQQLQLDFAEMAGRGPASGARRDGLTDPAHDLHARLRELMGDLQRARAASGPLRSFAPPASHRRYPAPVADLLVLAEVS